MRRREGALTFFSRYFLIFLLFFAFFFFFLPLFPLAVPQVPLGVRSLLQLSNERIEKVMEEAAQVCLSPTLSPMLSPMLSSILPAMPCQLFPIPPRSVYLRYMSFITLRSCATCEG